MIPKRTPISWETMIYNEIFVAPKRIWNAGVSLLLHKKAFYEKVEKQDYENLISGKDAGKWAQ
jgi:hypothetical protein